MALLLGDRVIVVHDFLNMVDSFRNLSQGGTGFFHDRIPLIHTFQRRVNENLGAVGGFCRVAGERSNFIGNNRKAFSALPGSCCFDGGV